MPDVGKAVEKVVQRVTTIDDRLRSIDAKLEQAQRAHVQVQADDISRQDAFHEALGKLTEHIDGSVTFMEQRHSMLDEKLAGILNHLTIITASLLKIQDSNLHNQQGRNHAINEGPCASADYFEIASDICGTSECLEDTSRFCSSCHSVLQRLPSKVAATPCLKPELFESPVSLSDTSTLESGIDILSKIVANGNSLTPSTLCPSAADTPDEAVETVNTPGDEPEVQVTRQLMQEFEASASTIETQTWFTLHDISELEFFSDQYEILFGKEEENLRTKFKAENLQLEKDQMLKKIELLQELEPVAQNLRSRNVQLQQQIGTLEAQIKALELGGLMLKHMGQEKTNAGSS